MIERLDDGRVGFRFRAIEVQQKIGNFYIAAIPAKELVEITYSDVRRMASEQRDVERYLGIQRPVSTRRINQIRDYLTSPDASFPTAVVLAVDERCAEFDPESGELALFAYPGEAGFDEEIPFHKIAKVLDGQHRLAGFLDKDDNYSFDFEEDGPFEINVSIFIGADLSQQATVFATVNLAQTKVNRSLVYDLEDFSKARSPYKTCHDISVALDSFGSPEADPMKNGPLFQRIKRLGVATPGRKGETITQASFVESLVTFISLQPLVDRNTLLDGRKLTRANESDLEKIPFRNMFLDGLDLDIAEIVNNYFSAVRRKWPDSWNNPHRQGNILPKTNAFKAFMKFLKEDVYKDAVGGRYGEIPTV
ncbi:DGQHR domain-containing protein, partial [Phaeobacter italicus]|uniref:DGQHR domain-containing protein n=1 Tax=Phaeobacter italicus TaxID=481446 RepID=UPI00295E5663